MTVLPDPYDPSDSITSVEIFGGYAFGVDDLPHAFNVTLHRDSGNVFTGCLDSVTARGIEYDVLATNRQGLRRFTGHYVLRRANLGGIPNEPEARFSLGLHAAPNPASGSLALTFTMPSYGRWDVTVSDMLGRVVQRLNGEDAPGAAHARLDVVDLPPGSYHCTLRAAGRIETTMLRVVR